MYWCVCWEERAELDVFFGAGEQPHPNCWRRRVGSATVSRASGATVPGAEANGR